MTTARKSQISGTILLTIIIFLFSLPAYAKYGGGTGEPNDPYLIYTAEQMNAIGTEPNDWDKHFKLMDDIDLGSFTGISYNIIGSEWDNPFTGVFDGNNHTISNFTYSPTRMPFISGLFGQVGSFEFQANAVIKDLGLIDPNIDAGTGWWVGSLAGLFVGGTITNCYVQGGSVSGDQDVGGLVGGAALMFNSSVRPDELSNSADYQRPEIFNCYTTCDVSGNENVGGLLGGGNLHLKISRCYSTGSISGDKWIGGLVGRNNGNISTCYSTASVLGNEDVGGLVGRKVSGKIYGCYSTGSVSGDRCIGGLVGRNAGIIEDCYSAGYVSGTTNVGGLLGSSTRSSVYTSFWDFETSGQIDSVGGIGLTTAEMQSASTFLEAGWDFVDETENGTEDVWKIFEDLDYPRLWWEKYGGGTGGPNNPYLIYTAEHMSAIGSDSNDWDKHFKLMADIDMSSHSETGYNPIGFVTYHLPYEYASYFVMEGTAFTGTFDGNGRKIRNFSCRSREYAGLFGVMGYSGVLKNLTLIDPNVSSENGSAGVLVSSVLGATIRQCRVQNGTVSAPNGAAGGLVGGNRGDLLECSFTGRVLGCDYVGGLIGDSSGTIARCFSIAEVSGDGPVGGLVGRFRSAVDGRFYIRDCYSCGRVTGTNQMGGLVGLHEGPKVVVPVTASLFNCYSVAVVTGMDKVGGLIGEQLHDAVSDNVSLFWDIQTSTQAASAGGIGRTTGEMQMESTFLDAGWDLVGEDQNGTEDIWWILEGQDYPRLSWEAHD